MIISSGSRRARGKGSGQLPVAIRPVLGPDFGLEMLGIGSISVGKERWEANQTFSGLVLPPPGTQLYSCSKLQSP